MKLRKKKSLREFYHQDEDAWMADDNFQNPMSDDDMYSDYLEQDYNDYTDSMDLDDYPSQEQDNEYYGGMADDAQSKKYYIAQNGERIPGPSKVSLGENDISKIIRENISNFLNSTLLFEDKKRDVAKKRTYDVIRQHFTNIHLTYFLDRPFVDEVSNPDNLNAIDYMFKVFDEEFFHRPMPDHAIITMEPYIAQIAFYCDYQNLHPVAEIIARLRDMVARIWMQYLDRLKFYTKQGSKTPKGDAASEVIQPITAKLKELSESANEKSGSIAMYKYLNSIVGKELDNDDTNENNQLSNDTYENRSNLNWTIDSNVDYNKMHNVYFPHTCAMCYGDKRITWEEGQYADTQYTNGEPDYDVNKLYVILMDGWENIPQEHTECLFPEIFGNEPNSPYDMYGLSMLFVWVTPKGKISACNTRWNHSASYTGNHSVDKAFNRVELSKILGVNFNSVFKGNTEYANVQDHRTNQFREEQELRESIKSKIKKMMG